MWCLDTYTLAWLTAVTFLCYRSKDASLLTCFSETSVGPCCSFIRHPQFVSSKFHSQYLSLAYKHSNSPWTKGSVFGVSFCFCFCFTSPLLWIWDMQVCHFSVVTAALPSIVRFCTYLCLGFWEGGLVRWRLLTQSMEFWALETPGLQPIDHPLWPLGSRPWLNQQSFESYTEWPAQETCAEERTRWIACKN